MENWDLSNTFFFMVSVSLWFLPLGNKQYWWGLINQEQWGRIWHLQGPPLLTWYGSVYTDCELTLPFNFLDLTAHNTDSWATSNIDNRHALYLDFCRLKMSYGIRPFFFLSKELISERSESTRTTSTWLPSPKCHRTSLLNPDPLSSYSGLLSLGGTGTLPQS